MADKATEAAVAEQMETCWICLQDSPLNSKAGEGEELMKPCRCNSYVHRSCLNEWRHQTQINPRNFWNCPNCTTAYQFRRYEEPVNSEDDRLLIRTYRKRVVKLWLTLIFMTITIVLGTELALWAVDRGGKRIPIAAKFLSQSILHGGIDFQSNNEENVNSTALSNATWQAHHSNGSKKDEWKEFWKEEFKGTHTRTWPYYLVVAIFLDSVGVLTWFAFCVGCSFDEHERRRVMVPTATSSTSSPGFSDTHHQDDQQHFHPYRSRSTRPYRSRSHSRTSECYGCCGGNDCCIYVYDPCPRSGILDPCCNNPNSGCCCVDCGSCDLNGCSCSDCKGCDVGGDGAPIIAVIVLIVIVIVIFSAVFVLLTLTVRQSHRLFERHAQRAYDMSLEDLGLLEVVNFSEGNSNSDATASLVNALSKTDVGPTSTPPVIDVRRRSPREMTIVTSKNNAFDAIK